MIEQIECDGEIFGMIIKASYTSKNSHSLTPQNFNQQLLYTRHEAGFKRAPEKNTGNTRIVKNCQEVLFIKSGKVRVTFYDLGQNYVAERIAKEGDVIVLVSGGHGFEMLEQAEIIEVKQGPYVGENEKKLFKPLRKSINLLVPIFTPYLDELLLMAG